MITLVGGSFLNAEGDDLSMEIRGYRVDVDRLQVDISHGRAEGVGPPKRWLGSIRGVDSMPIEMIDCEFAVNAE